MDKGVSSSLFVNDGSFMERFKQLQHGQVKSTSVEDSKSTKTVTAASSVPKPVNSKTNFSIKPNDARKTSVAAPGGKLAFSLKQKTKIVAPAVKLGEDEDEDEGDAGNSSDDGLAKRQKLDHPDSSSQLSSQTDVAPPPPSDPTVKKVADKLASFVAKKGRQFEHITRQKNPGDTPFKFLFDKNCPEYKYYEHQLHEEEKMLAPSRESQGSLDGNMSASSASGSKRTVNEQLNYQIPASALYEASEANSVQAVSGKYEPDRSPSGADPISMMEYFMKKAAQEERKRPPKQSQDEMPPPPSLQAPTKRGHHMGDYIPPEELEKFLASCNDVAARKAAREAAEKAKIQADNVGHKLLSKMGWKEGEGLGSSRKGIADPIMAGNVKSNNLGVGAQNPGEVTPEDDIYEQYKKRMMLGYRHRPNPLGNPRKAYY